MDNLIGKKLDGRYEILQLMVLVAWRMYIKPGM